MSDETWKRRCRFIGKIDKETFADPDLCWEWRGTYFSGKNYGQFWWGEIDGKDKTISAHRASWLLHKGEITGGLHVLHKCNNSKCVNYFHLYLGTHENNMRDRDNAGRTSKGAHRYNFRRDDKLIAEIVRLRIEGYKVVEIKEKLNIGHGTYYRCAKAIPADVNHAMTRKNQKDCKVGYNPFDYRK